MSGKDDSGMRDRAEWMNPVDDLVLEWLEDNPVGTPKRIAADFERHNHYIGERLRLLARYGLVDRIDRGIYCLTDVGEDYLHGRVDASTLESSDLD